MAFQPAVADEFEDYYDAIDDSGVGFNYQQPTVDYSGEYLDDYQDDFFGSGNGFHQDCLIFILGRWLKRC